MNEIEIKYIIASVLSNADDAMQEAEDHQGDPFYSGKSLAYYEVLDTIRNELSARGQNLKEFGLDIDLETKLL